MRAPWATEKEEKRKREKKIPWIPGRALLMECQGPGSADRHFSHLTAGLPCAWKRPQLACPVASPSPQAPHPGRPASPPLLRSTPATARRQAARAAQRAGLCSGAPGPASVSPPLGNQWVNQCGHLTVWQSSDWTKPNPRHTLEQRVLVQGVRGSRGPQTTQR